MAMDYYNGLIDIINDKDNHFSFQVIKIQYLTDSYNPNAATSCSNLGETHCHSSATCRDDDNRASQGASNFCCSCMNGW